MAYHPAMGTDSTDRQAPAGETEKATREDGGAMPPQAPDPKAGKLVRPDSDKGSGGAPPEEVEGPGEPPKMA